MNHTLDNMMHKVLLLFCCVSLLCSTLPADAWRSRPGGLTDEKAATDEVIEMAGKLKSSAEGKLCRKFTKFEVISYASQIVAGTNYFIKVKIEDDEYIVMRVFVPLPYLRKKPTLSAVKANMKKSDPIEYFEPSQQKPKACQKSGKSKKEKQN